VPFPNTDTQFKPGNPKPKTSGKKKGYCDPAKELEKLLDKKIAYEDPTTKKNVKGKIGVAVALRTIYNALEGDQKACEYIMNRIAGKPAEKHEITGADNGPVIIKWES
jgi:hypothetical protein